MNYYLLYDDGIVDDSGAKQKWLHFPRAQGIGRREGFTGRATDKAKA